MLEQDLNSSSHKRRIQISTLKISWQNSRQDILVFIRTDAPGEWNSSPSSSRHLGWYVWACASCPSPTIWRALSLWPSPLDGYSPRETYSSERMHPLHIPFCMRAVAGTPVQANLCNMVMRFAICGKGVSCSNKI